MSRRVVRRESGGVGRGTLLCASGHGEHFEFYTKSHEKFLEVTLVYIVKITSSCAQDKSEKD